MQDLIVSRKHSRIPVYRKGLDEIVGIVYVRNLLSYLNAESGDAPVTRLMTPPLFVPETKKVADLFREMQGSAEHIAIVINEHGAVSGLVSIEDLIEEIVGEIRDEDEMQLVDLISEGDGSYIVRGAAEIENLEKALGLSLGVTHFTTVFRRRRLPDGPGSASGRDHRYQRHPSRGSRRRSEKDQHPADPPGAGGDSRPTRGVTGRVRFLTRQSLRIRSGSSYTRDSGPASHAVHGPARTMKDW